MTDAAAALECAETANDDHPVWELLEACHDVDWAFWPEGAYGSHEAAVSIDLVCELVHALLEYKRAAGE
jgi:hypothetical protein